MSSISDHILQLTCSDADLVQRIKSSNVLLVGAGGIGCEVLKGLLLTGFPRITIIDLDTIDVSNLNRQFLYNKTHVGKSKAEVAARVSVDRFSHRDPEGQPISEVIPIHDSILNLKYDRRFYQQFTFVINALDNNATRVHVNRLCLASGLPLIESGSAGYFGNVTLIKGGVTKCFECDPPKKDENTYASCTIRNTPSLPIHCIVWAKHLFAQLFGQSDEDISPDATVLSSSNDQNNSIPNEQPSNQTTRQYVESIDYDSKSLFDKIFYHDILYLKGMKNLWVDRKNRREPQELLYDKIKNGELCFEDQVSSQQQQESSVHNQQTNGSTSSPSSSKIISDQRLWSMSECLNIFVKSLSKLKERLKTEQCLEWDKDDEIAVDFVAAVSNFRCYCFYIPRKSKFEVKSLAGNIIPAISTTNTVVGGGYVLLQTIRLLQSLLPERIFKTTTSSWQPSEEEFLEESQRLMNNGFSVFISNKNLPNLSKIAIEQLLPPKPNCIACSGQVKEVVIELPFSKITLADLIEQIVVRKFKTVAPDINCYDLKKMIYAADDEEDLKQPDSFYRTSTLDTLDYFADNICLNVKDLEQDFEINIRLKNIEFNVDEEEKLNGELFRILMAEDELNSIYQQKKMKMNDDQQENGRLQQQQQDQIDIDLVEEASSPTTALSFKRKRSEQKTTDNTIDILDDNEELICLNDNDKHENLIPKTSKRLKIN